MSFTTTCASDAGGLYPNEPCGLSSMLSGPRGGGGRARRLAFELGLEESDGPLPGELGRLKIYMPIDIVSSINNEFVFNKLRIIFFVYHQSQ